MRVTPVDFSNFRNCTLNRPGYEKNILLLLKNFFSAGWFINAGVMGTGGKNQQENFTSLHCIITITLNRKKCWTIIFKMPCYRPCKG